MEIDKIDKDVKEYFEKLVTNEFQGHDGLALKYLCDLHKGICPNGHEELEIRLEQLEVAISDLQSNQKTESKKSQVKSIGGQVIK